MDLARNHLLSDNIDSRKTYFSSANLNAVSIISISLLEILKFEARTRQLQI